MSESALELKLKEFWQENIGLKSEIEKLKAENAELKWFADKMNQYVLPGTTDTQDSALAAFAKLTRQRDTLKKALNDISGHIDWYRDTFKGESHEFEHWWRVEIQANHINTALQDVEESE